MLLKIFAAGDGVASRDQESVQIADSPTRRYGESIETARKLVYGTYADLNYAKTSENLVHCCVPLIKIFWG